MVSRFVNSIVVMEGYNPAMCVEVVNQQSGRKKIIQQCDIMGVVMQKCSIVEAVIQKNR